MDNIMGTPEEIGCYYVQLAERLIACDEFRNVPGMLSLPKAEMLTYVCGSRAPSYWQRCSPSSADIDTEFLPELRDPATQGCVVALVRQKQGAMVHAEPDKHDDTWYIWKGAMSIGRGDTEMEAWIVAFEFEPPIGNYTHD